MPREEYCRIGMHKKFWKKYLWPVISHYSTSLEFKNVFNLQVQRALDEGVPEVFQQVCSKYAAVCCCNSIVAKRTLFYMILMSNYPQMQSFLHFCPLKQDLWPLDTRGLIQDLVVTNPPPPPPPPPPPSPPAPQSPSAPVQAQLPISPPNSAGSNPALDFSRESLLSDEEARVDSVVLAPLKRKQLKRRRRFRVTDLLWKRPSSVSFQMRSFGSRSSNLHDRNKQCNTFPL